MTEGQLVLAKELLEAVRDGDGEQRASCILSIGYRSLKKGR